LDGDLMFFQIIITVAIIAFAVYLLYKNVKKKASGQCDCGSCSSHCSNYKSEAQRK
jgi:ferrous iron transport protein B